MIRRCAVALVAVAVCSLGSSLRAEEPHEAWLKFFEGNWTWTTSGGQSGDITYERFGDSPALVIKIKGNQGTSVGLIGWDKEAKAFLNSGFDSSGGRETVKHTKVEAKQTSGEWIKYQPDGTAAKATFTMKRVSDDEYQLAVSIKSEDGEEDRKIDVTVKRKK